MPDLYRDALIRQHMPIAQTEARCYHRRYARDTDTYDDYVSDAYLGLVRAVDSHDPERGQLEPHIVMSCRHAILDRLRAQHGARRVAQPAYVDSLDEIAERVGDEPRFLAADEPGYGHVDDDVTTAQNRAWIDRALDQLKPRDADIVRAYYYRGDTLQRIADRYGITESAACRALKAARRRLATHPHLAHLAQ